MNGGWGISYEIAPLRMWLDFTDDKSTLVQVMAWCRQATSHYLSQCWPISRSPNCVTRPQWVNVSVVRFPPSESTELNPFQLTSGTLKHFFMLKPVILFTTGSSPYPWKRVSILIYLAHGKMGTIWDHYFQINSHKAKGLYSYSNFTEVLFPVIQLT